MAQGCSTNDDDDDDDDDGAICAELSTVTTGQSAYTQSRGEVALSYGKIRHRCVTEAHGFSVNTGRG
jgi:hypothetical protein